MALCPMTGESSLLLSELKQDGQISAIKPYHILSNPKTAPGVALAFKHILITIVRLHILNKGI